MGADVVPRDDRAWPRRSLAVSVLLIVVALGAGAGLAFGAAGRGVLAVCLVVGGFLVAFGFGLVTSVPVMREWIAGRDMPAQLRLMQAAALVVAFVLVALVDVPVGWALISGLTGGVLVVNVWAIRAARANRDLVDQSEARAASAEPGTDEVDAAVDERGQDEAGQDIALGRILRDTVRVERRRAVAWLIAGVLALVACGALDAPWSAISAIAFIGGLAFLDVSRRLWAAWRALADFSKAATPPRRAFVVLLNDPAPKTIRPLLGVWSEPPVPKGGRLPEPEQVYRCDDELDALMSFQGSVVVHEAWVDTGPRRWSKPSWVAADAGIALPHRTAVLGRWYMSRLIYGERPGRPERLTLRQPHPAGESTPVIVEQHREGGKFLAALSGRVAALSVCGLLAYWLI